MEPPSERIDGPSRKRLPDEKVLNAHYYIFDLFNTFFLHPWTEFRATEKRVRAHEALAREWKKEETSTLATDALALLEDETPDDDTVLNATIHKAMDTRDKNLRKQTGSQIASQKHQIEFLTPKN